MGLKSGSRVSSQAQLVTRLVYPPPGTVPPDGALRDIRIQQTDTVQPTTLPLGTGVGTFDLSCINDKSIPASSSLMFDLFTGTDLPGAEGETCAFRIVRRVWISILSGGTSGIRIGGAASNEFSAWFVASGDKSDIYAGGPHFDQGDAQVGKTVTSSTKNLKVENLSTTAAAVVRISVTGSAQVVGGWVGPWFGLVTYP